MSAAITAGEALRRLAKRFAAAGLATPDLDARVLVLAATGLSHTGLIAAPETMLAGERLARLEAMAAQRLSRQPVSRIIGRREFYGREFYLSSATLDPRPDTETLIEHVLGWARGAGRDKDPLRLLDLGTGSGALIITLLAELPAATGTGSDNSPPALKQARANAERLGVGERATFIAADWGNGICGQHDAIVANPPYIRSADLGGLEPEVRLADPLSALDGGADGLDAYRAIAGDAARLLAPGGIAAFEVGEGQHEAVEALCIAAGLRPDGVTGGRACDLSGRVRVVSFCAPANGLLSMS